MSQYGNSLRTSPERASSYGNICCIYYLRYQDYTKALPQCEQVYKHSLTHSLTLFAP
jgi:hypothetical protein